MILYKGKIVEKALIKRNVYVSVEAESEEEALQLLKDGYYDVEEEEDIEDLGSLDILSEEIIDVYD